MMRAAGGDERPHHVQVCACALEQPGVGVPEAERPELVEAPVGDAAILEGQLVMGRVLFGRGHCVLPFQEGLLSYVL